MSKPCLLCEWHKKYPPSESPQPDSLRGRIREMLFYEGWEEGDNQYVISRMFLESIFKVLIRMLGDERE